jgi:hypothetical protein
VEAITLQNTSILWKGCKVRGQASVETMVSIGLILAVITIVTILFTGQRDEVALFEETYGAEQVCFAIRDLMISMPENGTSSVLDVPFTLNKKYTIEFIGYDLHINTERGFFCTLPAPVYNSTNATRFEVAPGRLTFTNLNGRIYFNVSEVLA